MRPITVRPTRIDKDVSRAIARHTDARVEHGAELVTWGADEHVLLLAASIGWLVTRKADAPVRRFGTHVLLCSAASAVLPHLLKTLINQERPDRCTVQGHWRGIPFSGKADDAFPSGHAVHVGALASAATLLPPKAQAAVWATGALLVTTRVVLLAHWVTDVLAGLATGVLLERLLRRVTKPSPPLASRVRLARR